MCSKHQGCHSKTTPQNVSSVSCSSSKNTQIKAVSVENDSCCSSDTNSCCGGSDPTEESDPIGLESVHTQSWKVEGMDCPSCARKIETAINNINGVTHAKVLFATEKLVVSFEDASLFQTIESTALETGFVLNQKLNQPTKKDDFSKFGLFKQNIKVISLAVAMLASFALRSFFPVFSEWAFVAICLLGLIPIGKKAITLAKSGIPFSIETLMSVAALGALYLGESVEAAMVLLLFLLGEKLEAYASSRARSGVQSLMALVPEDAIKIVNGERMNVPANELVQGDVIEISPGSRLPADGIVQSTVSIDESALTGESLPAEYSFGDQVMAGSVVIDKVVRLNVTSKQGENAIDRILHLIEEAESHKAPLERFLDRFSRWYTPAMMMLALLVIITPPLLFSQPWETWIYRGLALLLIACPCALVISTPAAITSGLAVAAKRGALIKGGAALETLGQINTVAFDKTGTLTKGEPKVTDITPFGGFDRYELLQLSASIEVGSTHPLARSLVECALAEDITLSEADDKQALAGVGVSGSISDVLYRIVSPTKVDIPLSNEVGSQVEALESHGKTVVIVVKELDVIGVIAWQDTIRSDAKQAIDKLHNLGISTLMLTGDNVRSAKGISDQLGVEYKAGLLPEDKVGFIQKLSIDNRVAMVGDGINDAPAMKASSIGIAMGSGTDVALETADSALTHNRLTDVADVIVLSRATLANIRQNITLALGLKAVFLVTSLLGITGLWVAVLADSGATLLVTANALRLLRFKP